MQKEFTIKKANIVDVNSAAKLLTKYRTFYKRAPASEKELIAFVETRIKYAQSVIFLAYLNNDAVGIAQLYPSYTTLGLGKLWILNDLFISKNHRGFGIGKALLEKAVDFSKKDGAKRLYLKTEHDNLPAKQLYENFGFKQDDYMHYVLEI